MWETGSSARVVVRATAAALCGVMFATDLVTPPLNVSLCWGYCAVVLLALLDPWQRAPFWYALVATTLAIVGAPFGPQADDGAPIYIANRAIAVAVDWVIAAAIYHRKLADALMRAQLHVEQDRNRGYRRDLTALTHAIMRRLTVIDGQAHRMVKRAVRIDRNELAARVAKIGAAARDIGHLMRDLQRTQDKAGEDGTVAPPPQL